MLVQNDRVIPAPQAAADLVCAALRGESPAWPFDNSDSAAERFLDFCVDQGVQVILHDRAQHLPWPDHVLSALRRNALARAGWELAHLHLLRRVLRALVAAGVEALLFKGTALAYGLYPQPFWRVRADTDLLIPCDQRDHLRSVFAELDVRLDGTPQAEFLAYEVSARGDHAGVSHLIDVHWRIHYSQHIARLLPFSLLARDATALPAVSDVAKAVSLPHAFLLTCVHRANDLRLPTWGGEVPCYGADRLIWLYDIHLMLQAMSEAELSELARLIERLGLGVVCGDPIDLARARFGSRVPVHLLAAVSRAARRDPVARYHAMGPVRQRWSDFLALRSASGRLRYFAEHCLPPEDYMRQRYPGQASPILALHARRLLDGARRWRRLGRTTRPLA